MLGRSVAELMDSKPFDDVYPSSVVLEDQKLTVVGRHQNYYGYYYPGGGIGIPGGVGGGPVRAGLTAPASIVDANSDRLMIFDLAGRKFGGLFDKPTGMYNSDLVGQHSGRLLMNLQDDGFLVVDVSDPAAPQGRALHPQAGLGQQHRVRRL